ncbi:MAG: sulfotransferase [Nocardioides sp.]
MSAPILVTGVPRSGTTWLARVLATSPRAALAGREPMNPRGRQYALGGTLPGWASLSDLTVHQRIALRSAYRGCNPLVFGRYGRRQWAAPLPWVRVVVKDPFALLSLPVIASTTGALPVVLFRHPGAVLASYQRMGWQPDLDELQGVLSGLPAESGRARDLPARAASDPLVAMGWFWSTLYDLALDGLESTGTSAVIVSHEELADNGEGAGRALFEAVGLSWGPATTHEFAQSSSESSVPQDPTALHNLHRSGHEAATGWRSRLTDSEISTIEQVTEETRDRLDRARLQVSLSLS